MPDCTSSEQKYNVKHSSRPVIFANPKPIPADDALLSRSPGKIIPAAPYSNQQLLTATHAQKPVRQAEQLLGFFPTPSTVIQPHFAPLPSP